MAPGRDRRFRHALPVSDRHGHCRSLDHPRPRPGPPCADPFSGVRTVSLELGAYRGHYRLFELNTTGTLTRAACKMSRAETGRRPADLRIPHDQHLSVPVVLTGSCSWLITFRGLQSLLLVVTNGLGHGPAGATLRRQFGLRDVARSGRRERAVRTVGLPAHDPAQLPFATVRHMG